MTAIAAQAFAGAISPPFMPTRLALPTWVSGVANNPSSTRPRRLFFTPTILARFQANWVNPYCTGTLGPIKRGINFAAGDAGTQSVVKAVNFLATGASDATAANAAATQALSAPFSAQYTGYTCYAEPCALVLDWCYDKLTVANRQALISQINTNINTHISQFDLIAKPSCNVDQGETSGRQNIPIGIIAIQGEQGATDRNLMLRNYMQNWTDSTNEGYGDGCYPTYMYEDSIIPQMTLAYEIATGQDTGFLYNLNRAEVVARMRLGQPGFGYNVVGGDQVVQALGVADGGVGAVHGQDFAPYMAYALASHYKISNPTIAGLWQWIGDTGISSGNFPNWAYLTDSAMWIGVAMWDSTIAGKDPLTSGLKKNRVYLSEANSAHFRSGWTPQGPSCVDVRSYLWSVPPRGHTMNFGGSLVVHRGMDDLLHHGGVYSAAGGSGRGFVEQDGAYAGKGWASSSNSRNTINFSSFSSTPDTDGQQMDATQTPPPAYATYLYTTTAAQYTPTANVFNNRGGTGRRGEITFVDLPADESYATVFLDISDQYPSTVATNVTRKITSIPGPSPGQLTLLVRDQFTLPSGGSGTQRVKWGYFSREKPSVISDHPPVLRAGTLTAGIITYNGAAVSRTSAPTITEIRPASSSVGSPWELINGATTHSNNLTLAGNAVAGATVKVYVDGVLASTSTADAGGNWGLDTGPIADAVHVFTVTQTVSGVVSPPSLPYTVTVVPNITAFSPTSGGTVTMGTVTWNPINANQAWSLTNPDPHTLQFELRSGDTATSGLHQSSLKTAQLFGFNAGPFLTFEMMLTGPVNDQFGAGKSLIFVELHDTVSTTLRAPTLLCLGGLQAPAVNGDQVAIDLGYGTITGADVESATYVNRYIAPANLTRDVFHKFDIGINPNNNATNNQTTAAVGVNIDGASAITLPQGNVGTPIGYFSASPNPVNSHYIRIGLLSSGGGQTQQIKMRNVLCKRFLQAIS